MKPPYNFLLRSVALVAGIPAIYLRAINGSEFGVVALTLFFYSGAYLTIVIAPPRWAGLQLGFSIGYSLTMEVSLFIVLLMQIPFANVSASDLQFFRIARYSNAALLAVAVGTWIWNRRNVDSWSAFGGLLVGIVYPLVAFLAEMTLASPFYR